MRIFHKSIIALVMVFFAIAGTATAGDDVSFLKAYATNINGRTVTIEGGSVWMMDSNIPIVAFDEVVIVFSGQDPLPKGNNLKLRINSFPRRGTLTFKGSEVGVTLVSGMFIRTNGQIATVVRVVDDGKVVELDDGSAWNVPTYDQYDTRFWIPPYKVIVYANRLYLLNIGEAKRIWVRERR